MQSIRSTDIVFLGDSLTEGFNLSHFFPEKKPINRGISGDTTTGVIYRLEEITQAKPLAVFLMIGINDLFHGVLPDKIYSNIVTILELIHDKSFGTHIYLQSLLPVNEEHLFTDVGINTMIYALNDRLRKYCKDKKFKYIDLHSEYLNRSGEMDQQFTFDGVHLSEKGYQLWAHLIKKETTGL
ncbi:MAG: hypothetical protein KDC05_05830 [Bacteroidales bacterium]|nr:hypothetical protein [Bacteroidales bacterium]